jgi:hypothetical protein
MRRRRSALGALLLALMVASTLYVAAGLRVFANYRAANGLYTLTCDGMLAWVPPSSLYAGFYYNQPAFVSVQARSSQPSVARITVVIPGFTAPQTYQASVGSTFQSLPFKPQLLAQSPLTSLAAPGRLRAELVATAQFRGRPSCQLSTPITLFSRQWIRWRDGGTQTDMTPYIAGWVTPHSPAIATLVGRASQRLRAHPELYDSLPALFGYDQGQASGSQVRDEVDAIFDTLQNDYHMRYTADNAPFTADSSQIVQAPSDILSGEAPSGMCVETTVILASAVERLGMRPLIVFTSSHAYLGVALRDAQDAPITYWETSDLNGSTLGSQANVDGDTEFAKDLSTHAVTDIVDIASERARGIQPNQ